MTATPSTTTDTGRPPRSGHRLLSWVRETVIVVVVNRLTPGPFAVHRGDVVVFADPGGKQLEGEGSASSSAATTSSAALPPGR